MPVSTMALATSLTMSSLMSQWNLFQVLKPMGGVRALPLQMIRSVEVITFEIFSTREDGA
jgi:hypothetical protein